MKRNSSDTPEDISEPRSPDGEWKYNEEESESSESKEESSFEQSDSKENETNDLNIFNHFLAKWHNLDAITVYDPAYMFLARRDIQKIEHIAIVAPSAIQRTFLDTFFLKLLLFHTREDKKSVESDEESSEDGLPGLMTAKLCQIIRYAWLKKSKEPEKKVINTRRSGRIKSLFNPNMEKTLEDIEKYATEVFKLYNEKHPDPVTFDNFSPSWEMVWFKDGDDLTSMELYTSQRHTIPVIVLPWENFIE